MARRHRRGVRGGRVTATPHAPPPNSARLKAYPVREINGFIFAYWDHAGRPPEWHIPDFSPAGCSGRVMKRRRLRSHPQATTENSVDFGHLLHVHGYGELKQLAPTTIEGPCLNSHYSFTRHMLTRGLRNLHFAVNIKISVWGLGVSLVEVNSPAMGLKILQWVLADAGRRRRDRPVAGGRPQGPAQALLARAATVMDQPRSGPESPAARAGPRGDEGCRDLVAPTLRAQARIEQGRP